MNAAKKSTVFTLLKYIGISFVLLLGLLFALPVVFSDTIKTEIKKYANTKLEGDLNYANANLSFFKHFPSLTLTLDNVQLKGSAPFEKENFVTAKALSFGINLTSLVFSKTVDIDQIFLEEGNINVKVNKEGQANYNVYKGEESKEKTQSGSTSIQLEKIEIIKSKVVYDDQSTNVHFDFFDFNYTGNGDLSKDIFDLYSNVKIAKMNLLYANESYLMDKKIEGDLITKVNVNSLSFIFEENNLNINNLLVDFKGRFDILKEGYFMDFNVKSDNSELYDVFNALPPKFITWLQKTDLKGKANLLFTLKGKYSALENLNPDLQLDFQVKDGFVNYNKSKYPVSNFNCDASIKVKQLDPNQLETNIKSIQLNILQEYLKAQWFSHGIDNLALKGNFESKIDLEKLNNALGITDIVVKGMLSGKGTVDGVYNAKSNQFPRTDVDVNLQNGYIKTPYYPNPISAIQSHFIVKNENENFESLKVKIHPSSFEFEKQPFTITADLENFNDLIYDVKAKGTLDIGKIYQVFAQKGIDVEGMIKADLTLKGRQSDAEKGTYAKLYNKGTLEIKNIGVISSYLPKKFIIKDGIFKFVQDKMKFTTFRATYSDSDFRLNGYLQNVFNYLSPRKGTLKGAFTIQSNYINLDAFMSQEEVAENTSTTSAEKSAKPKTETSTGVIMIPKNLDLQFTAKAKKVRFQDLTLTNSVGDLKFKNGVVNLQNTSFDLIGCKVVMNGSYASLNPKKAVFDYAIKAEDFDIKRAYKEVKIFRELASAAEKASGIVSVDYKLKGRLNQKMEPVFPSLTGGGMLSVKDVKVYGMKMFGAVSSQTNHEKMKNPELKKVTIKSSIKNNIITIERFKFRFAGFRPRIEGTSSLDGRMNLKMRLGLPPFGIIGIPITVTGTKDNPKIKVGRETQDLEETEDKEEE